MIFETYARRKRKQSRNGEPEIYTYKMPEQLRHQISMASAEGIGRYHRLTGDGINVWPHANDTWEDVDKTATTALRCGVRVHYNGLKKNLRTFHTAIALC